MAAARGRPARRLPRAAVHGEDDSQAFKAFEAAGWTANAGGYGRLTGRITARVADALLDAAGVGPGTCVLDVGCGPGHLCAAAAARGARPTGIDLADGMLAAARRNHPALEFRRADAEALPFADGAFDAALAAFVVNHLPRPEDAAAELRRVLAPGGRLAVAMWGAPERVAFLGLVDEAMRVAGVRADAAVPPGPPAFRFADEGEMRALLEGAGLRDVTVEEIGFTVPIRDAAELWDGVRTGSVRTAAQLGALSDAERARVREALDAVLGPLHADGGLALETAVKIAVGVGPGG
jgi:SAM-dependent methyltransferase